MKTNKNKTRIAVFEKQQNHDKQLRGVKNNVTVEINDKKNKSSLKTRYIYLLNTYISSK